MLESAASLPRPADLVDDLTSSDKAQVDRHRMNDGSDGGGHAGGSV